MSTAPGTDVVADIAARLISDEPYIVIVFHPEFLLLTLYRVVYQQFLPSIPRPQDPLSIEGTRIVHWHIPRSNSFLLT